MNYPLSIIFETFLSHSLQWNGYFWQKTSLCKQMPSFKKLTCCHHHRNLVFCLEMSKRACTSSSNVSSPCIPPWSAQCRKLANEFFVPCQTSCGSPKTGQESLQAFRWPRLWLSICLLCWTFSSANLWIWRTLQDPHHRNNSFASPCLDCLDSFSNQEQERTWFSDMNVCEKSEAKWIGIQPSESTGDLRENRITRTRKRFEQQLTRRRSLRSKTRRNLFQHSPFSRQVHCQTHCLKKSENKNFQDQSFKICLGQCWKKLTRPRFQHSLSWQSHPSSGFFLWTGPLCPGWNWNFNFKQFEALPDHSLNWNWRHWPSFPFPAVTDSLHIWFIPEKHFQSHHRFCVKLNDKQETVQTAFQTKLTPLTAPHCFHRQ